MTCRHHDVQVFDGLRCCLACGVTVFAKRSDEDSVPHHLDVVSYHYTRLNYQLGQEIRILVLFPGHESDDLACDIVHVNLTDKPPYEALSYTWVLDNGDDCLSEGITCRGRVIPITKNCDAALRSLRGRARNRRLWVDAICINQEDVAERNHQVNFMQSIYSSASQVVIYLGPGSPFTDNLLDHLNEDFRLLGKLSHKEKTEFRVFLTRRWWHRVWVLQEVASAKLAVLVVGRKSIPWTMMAIQAVRQLCRTVNYPQPSTMNWFPASVPDLHPLEILRRGMNCSATDPRDKVFALLGLTDDKFQQAIPVDYSLTMDAVHMNVARYFIEKERDLSILKHVRNSRSKPSWVPKWTGKGDYNPLPAQFSLRKRALPSTSSYPYVPSSELENIAQSRPILLDRFLKVFRIDGPVISTAILLLCVEKWCADIGLSKFKSPTFSKELRYLKYI